LPRFSQTDHPFTSQVGHRVVLGPYGVDRFEDVTTDHDIMVEGPMPLLRALDAAPVAEDLLRLQRREETLSDGSGVSGE
jgi:hypothetical protein